MAATLAAALVVMWLATLPDTQAHRVSCAEHDQDPNTYRFWQTMQLQTPITDLQYACNVLMYLGLLCRPWRV